jgi:hypothetical protein
MSFILFTVIGTLSHEYGHILVAKYYGFSTTLSSGSMNYNSDMIFDKLDSISELYKYEIQNNKDFPQKKMYNDLQKKSVVAPLYISIGGPAQTILVGMIGLIFLLIRKNIIKNNGIKFIDWIGIFLSLFWLREVFNLATSLVYGLLIKNYNIFGGHGDEAGISNMLEIPEWIIPITLGVIGFGIAISVIFKFVPISKRLSFIIGGFIGGLLGFYLWIYVVGPKILP